MNRSATAFAGDPRAAASADDGAARLIVVSSRQLAWALLLDEARLDASGREALARVRGVPIGGVGAHQGERDPGGVTTALDLASSVTVEVVAGTNNATATVVRFFNVCRVGGTVQALPSGAVADVRAHAWACRPSF